jgi:hypothetical protein
MGKKNTPSARGTGLSAIRIGARVRCSDDGAEGRIAWANAMAVKIKWDDGEEVTWKRADLATKPIEFLDVELAEPAEQPPVAVGPAPEPPETPAAPTVEEQSAVPPAVGRPTAPEVTTAEPAVTAGPAITPDAQAPVTETPPAEQAPPHAAATPTTGAGPGEPLNAELPGEFAIPKRQRKPKTPAEPKVKKLSAIDAAAKVLAEAGAPMTCKELIGAMAAKGYWTSPGGRTPDATLHSSVLREITVKGAQSRFVKTSPGRFALRLAAPTPESVANGS